MVLNYQIWLLYPEPPYLITSGGKYEMRATDDRYRGEQARHDLAVRMISHEARTGTIRYWTGLSDDRIRKIYASYFKFQGPGVRRRRGRSPSQIGPLVCSPQRALEAGVLTDAMIANRLLCLDGRSQPELRRNIGLGHRFCESFESYTTLVGKPCLNFEWAWNLLRNMRRGDELGIERCETCSFCHVADLLAVPRSRCPSCLVVSELTVGLTMH
jgi:hypothetical protein